MAILTNDLVEKFGTQVSVDDGSTSLIASGAFSVAGDITQFTNSDNVLYASFVLECNFSVAPGDGVGGIDLYAHVKDVQSTNDASVPSANNKNIYVGSFPIDWDAGSGVTFRTVIDNGRLPNIVPSQKIDFYLHNNATAQSIAATWAMWISTKAIGPKA